VCRSISTNCEPPPPQSQCWSDPVWGFAILGTLTRLQCQIWFAYALETVYLLFLPPDPAVTSKALAIWIVFPPVGVTPASCSRPDGLATLRKRKGPLPREGAADR
jgi:hypothetical protein